VGRVEYFRSRGHSYRDIERDAGVLLVVAELNCRYKSPAFYDEEIIVRTQVAEATPRMIHFEYELIAVEGDRVLPQDSPGTYSAGATVSLRSSRRSIAWHSESKPLDTGRILVHSMP